MSENSCYRWYDWLISHITESMKKSEIDSKLNVMRLFESKEDNNTSTNYKTKKNEDAFEGKYVEYKSKKG